MLKPKISGQRTFSFIINPNNHTPPLTKVNDGIKMYLKESYNTSFPLTMNQNMCDLSTWH